MCGFIGATGEKISDTEIKLWAQQLNHRGPDSFNFFSDQEFNIAHARLAILGGMEDSNQPMQSIDERYTLAYNGEIYNFDELRDSLVADGVCFQTHGDTEVLLYGLITYGFRFLDRCIGMFAFGFCDNLKKTLMLARDRSGQKPLFIKKTESGMRFSSEQRPLIGPLDELSLTSLNEFLWFGFVLGKGTLVSDVYEHKAGYANLYDLKGDLLQSYKIGDLSYIKKGSKSEEDEFIDIFAESIERHLLSERKTCLLLSGGMDSALIATMCRRVLNRNIDCVSMGINDTNAINESSRAQQIAGICKHKFISFDMTELDLNDLQTFSQNIDTPVIDSSFLPMSKLCHAVSKDYTVGLTGDGADELFGGYYHHKRTRLMSSAINLCSFTSSFFREPNLKQNYTKQQKWGFIIRNAIKHRELIYNFYFTSEARKNLLGHYYDDINTQYPGRRGNYNGLYELALKNDYDFYLQKDILVKSDRMAMVNSLELRAPFLDDEFLSFSKTLHLKNKVSKKIIKNVLSRLLPEMSFSKKFGFSIPISHWIQKPEIENYVFDLIKSTGIFDKNFIDQIRLESAKSMCHGEEIYGLFVLASYMRNTGLVHK